MGTDLRDHLQATLSDTYTLERELGGGGMSRVFVAEERALGRKVVVKVLSPDLAASVSVDRFKREIQLTARLQHPHIVPILNAGEIGGLPFYTMPFVDGDSLRMRLVRSGPMTTADATSILRDVAKALQFAHEKGIVHRDIKPDNILLAGNTASVTDFGIGKAIAASRVENPEGNLTELGMAIGTPQYMAPEQIAADPAVDHRVDLYAFGCVAYELLAGEPPFAGRPPAALLRSHLIEQPPLLTSKRADVPDALLALISRCLEKDPNDRPASARELIDILDGTVIAQPMLPPRTGAMEAVGVRTVAVLPFVNLSGDADNEHFADGLTEEIITDLSMIKTLRVISRQSAMRLKGTIKSIPAIARELDTRYVLTGGIRRSGSSLRITAQLADATVDSQIWAEKYSGTVDDVFDMQEHLSRQIVEALRVTLTPAEDRRIAERPIADARAYVFYLMARQQIWSFTNEALERALQLIHRAQAIVGDNELLFASEGWIYWQYVNVGLRPVSTYDEYLRKAEQCAEKIFALNPDSAKGFGLRGAVRNNRADATGATRDFKRALALDPHNPDALLWLGYNYAASGQVPLARALMDRLLEVDPLTSINVSVYGMVAMMDGDYAEALRWTQRSVEIDPENPSHRMVHALMLAANKRESEAATMLDAVAHDTPHMAWAKLATAMSCALRGDRDGVLRVMTPELREAAWWDDIFSWWSADCFAIVGEKNDALDFLERAVEFGIINYPFLAEYEPFLANLRDEPRFGQLMVRVRKAWETFAA